MENRIAWLYEDTVNHLGLYNNYIIETSDGQYIHHYSDGREYVSHFVENLPYTDVANVEVGETIKSLFGDKTRNINPASYKKVYLSGPITSDPYGYKKRFADAEKRLTEFGFSVTNPSKDEYDYAIEDKGHTDKWTNEAWLDYIHEDINLVSKHDVICLLIGWEESKGALLEVATAKKFGLKLMLETEDGFNIINDWDLSVSISSIKGLKVKVHNAE